jgi:small subunit ribosomal protein S7
MSRRRQATKRPLAKDGKFQSTLVSRLVNTVMISGKKSTAQRIVYGAFDSISEKIRRATRWKFCSARWTTPSRASRPRPAASAAPPIRCRWKFPATARPRWRCAGSWILPTPAKAQPMKAALAAEILEAYQGQGNAIRKRDEVHKMAQANKAFAHFRW